jgi:hypothetical protein
MTWSFSIDSEVNRATLVSLRENIQLFCEVLRENKELVIGPGITLIPQIFLLPLFVVAFTLDCLNSESNRLRYLLIVSYFMSFTPQLISFFLYVLPSSFYSNEWHATTISGWINRFIFYRREPVSTESMMFSAQMQQTRRNDRTCDSSSHCYHWSYIFSI